ncbi:MAG TPA: antibiotic biosynthesis monooxygenase [archaeon]|nr:antibiotic biosynthesis monooxygenase [archaeon]
MKGNIWEFHVKEGCERQFEAMNRRNWPNFFMSSPHYRSTDIAKNLENSRIYLTVDKWDSREDFEEFKKAHRSEYDTIDSIHKELYESAKHVGWIDL